MSSGDPGEHTSGDLARHADLQLAELVAEHVFCAGVGRLNSELALNQLRLSFWVEWYERSGMWLSDDERASFQTALASAVAAGPPLPRAALSGARLIAKADAADACGAARGR